MEKRGTCAGFVADQRFLDAALLCLMRSLAGIHFVIVVRLALSLPTRAQEAADTLSDGLADLKNTYEKNGDRRSST